MRIYHHPFSACSRRVLITANYLNSEVELVLVDLFNGEQNSPEFLKLNPNHCVPVLEHNGFVLWESYAIMQYLADMTPNQTLYPTDIQARADVNRWLFWCAQDLMPGIRILNWENSVKVEGGMGAADQDEVVRGERLIIEAAKILDDHLADREWVCSSGLSLADFAIAAPLIDQHRAKFPIAKLSNLQRWLKKVQDIDMWENTEISAQ